MPEQDLVREKWDDALAAANAELKGAGGKTPAAQRQLYRTKAASAAAAVFNAAKAPIKVVRADIDWGDKPTVKLDVVTMKGVRYPRPEALAKPTAPEPSAAKLSSKPA